MLSRMKASDASGESECCNSPGSFWEALLVPLDRFWAPCSPPLELEGAPKIILFGQDKHEMEKMKSRRVGKNIIWELILIPKWKALRCKKQALRLIRVRNTRCQFLFFFEKVSKMGCKRVPKMTSKSSLGRPGV